MELQFVVSEVDQMIIGCHENNEFKVSDSGIVKSTDVFGHVDFVAKIYSTL